MLGVRLVVAVVVSVRGTIGSSNKVGLLEVRHVLDPVGGSTRREYVPRRGGHLLCCCRGVMNCYRCLSLGVFVGSTSGTMTGLWGI